MISHQTLVRLLRSHYAAHLFGDLIRVAVTALLLAVAGIALIYDAALVHALVGILHFNDFGKFYYSARQFLDHRDIYAATPATLIPVSATESRQLWNLNPPHFTLVVLPLTVFSPGVAFAIWSAVSLIAFAIAMRVIFKECQIAVTVESMVKLAAALCWFVGSTSLVATGQMSWLLMLPATLAWRANRRDQWTGAALWWGLCIGVKPFLAPLLLYFAVRRRYKATFLMLGTIAASFAIGMAVFGIEPHREWISKVQESVGWAWLSMNASFLAILSRTLASNPFFHQLVDTPFLVMPLWAVLCGAAVIAAVYSLYRTRSAPNVDEDLLLVMLLAILISPLGWVYYLWLPFGPAFALASKYRRWPTLIKVGLVGLFVPFHLTMLGQPNAILTVTIGSLYVWAVGLVYGGVVAETLQRSGHRKSPASLA